MKKILWRNERFVIFEPDRSGEYEVRLIENITLDATEIPIGFAAWFPTLEQAIGFASKSPLITRKENE